MATLQVELVAVERKIWSGEATMVIARTTEGELGVLPGHAPLLGQLAPGGVVTIRTESGDDLTVAAHGGFLSVTERGVSILAETAEISTEIDVARAREALSRAEAAGDEPGALEAARRAESRLRAAGETV
ncbi:F0F1 ATP synthase subunit epsilon [Blastococcus sp. TF02-09]|uniref:F0F1 ATP synthase subunit epsilon n=1 Tax=Blastococcus sp. TF02-09 TaxID=2250576 RepID=UPI000DE97132|nr:F0F1 ATP synthase subunit epsilon [Blastococcus sp. TF02-9]RBY77380.1 F0F1 ATP synthase subunit epsilon [Blastococcus sp. TF02-9]